MNLIDKYLRQNEPVTFKFKTCKVEYATFNGGVSTPRTLEVQDSEVFVTFSAPRGSIL